MFNFKQETLVIAFFFPLVHPLIIHISFNDSFPHGKLKLFDFFRKLTIPFYLEFHFIHFFKFFGSSYNTV